MKTLVLLTFCDEGDNTQDALDIVTYVNTMTQWIPHSTSQVINSATLVSINVAAICQAGNYWDG